MLYRTDKKGNKLSTLGFGCMRFTKKDGKLDIDKATAEIGAAVEGGVNYFDTAYVYPGSEVLLGEALARLGCRDRINIATKLPHYMIKSIASIEKCFNEELSRLKTDHIDYYLMHLLSDLKTWEKLKKLGIEEWIREKLESGKIRNIGFSYHGNTDMFIEIVDAYDWDFCQIQYNYLDEHTQAGRRGLEYAGEKGIPVIIMEPLRGGRLVNYLPEAAKECFRSIEPDRSMAEWGLRWLWDQPYVTVILSGMNSIEMVQDNIIAAGRAEAGCLSEEEKAAYEKVKLEITKATKVGCTGCNYCMPCPAGIDIPMTFRCYNEMALSGKSGARSEYLRCTAMKQKQSGVSLCIKCGRCEKHCPQSINIREELVNAGKALETPIYKIAKKGIKIFKLW